MTTIAYHHKTKTIAWDSRATEGSIIKNDSENKVRERDGVTFWFYGCKSDFDMFIDAWFGKELNVIPECQAIALEDGKFYGCAVNDDEIFWREELEANEAIGSGRYWALAAMDFEKSAKEAVEYAKTRDCHTGGEVRVIEMQKSEKSVDLPNPKSQSNKRTGGVFMSSRDSLAGTLGFGKAPKNYR